MNKLQPTEYSSQRILTTLQLAEAYGTDERRISENFNRNKDHYVIGKHYYSLEGNTLEDFKTSTQIAYSLKGINKLYLWTEKGALMHAKSLNTDQAWSVYEQLVDTYYRMQDQIQQLSVTPTYEPSSAAGQIAQLEQRIAQTEHAIEQMQLQIAARPATIRKRASKYFEALKPAPPLTARILACFQRIKTSQTIPQLGGSYFKNNTHEEITKACEDLVQLGLLVKTFTPHSRLRGRYELPAVTAVSNGKNN